MEQAYRSARAKLIVASKGLAMGTADIIPGVSGGTIALISGIYDHLIQAISSVQLRHVLLALELPIAIFRPARRTHVLQGLGEIPWNFLLPLIGGIVAAMLVMVRVIPFLLEHYPFYAYSFMFGLILFSISVPYRMMQHRVGEYALIALFAAAAFVLTGLSRVSDAHLELSAADSSAKIHVRTSQKGEFELRLPDDGQRREWKARLSSTAGGEDFRLVVEPGGTAPVVATMGPESTLAADILSVHQRGNPAELEVNGRLRVLGNTQPWFVFLSGAIAICAMILPGISGAYMLVVLGQYQMMLGAMRDLSGALPVLLSQGFGAAAAIGAAPAAIVGLFLAGILIGILSFVRLLKWLLARWHSLTMAALTGLMVGSLRAIWPGASLPEGGSLWIWILVGAGFAVAGAALVFALEMASLKLKDPDAPIHGP